MVGGDGALRDQPRAVPGGLNGLSRTLDRFRDQGFKVGLHFLAASIYPPDPYITPVPDRRLVLVATATLAADVDDKADVLPTVTAPAGFPAEDGGYEGDGSVLRVGDELISYGKRSTSPPYGLARCRRGYLGTRASAHRKGEPVAHLIRSYGYHLYDMDTTLLDEVAGHFARVADACRIDMIYFDGSERLQGDHWYYNARMQKAFLDKLQNKNILLQASSYSHYSWHLMARMPRPMAMAISKAISTSDRRVSIRWNAMGCRWTSAGITATTRTARSTSTSTSSARQSATTRRCRSRSRPRPRPDTRSPDRCST